MKKVNFLYVLVLTFMMVFNLSCSDDNEDLSPATASIEGKWEYSKIIEGVDGIKYPEENYENTTGCPKDYVELKPGGAFFEGYYGDGCVLELDEATWVRDGAIVTVVYEGEAESYEIVKVINATLKVKYSYNSDSGHYVYWVTFTKA
ncbi:lipocalin family protein [Flavobacterium flavipallidum]|uniref:Lipocalin family protein n=1 Tax=Flavobacterium flavipallidum TaxID=3139140 RepID=A0ABU9HK44_9FLAO